MHHDRFLFDECSSLLPIEKIPQKDAKQAPSIVIGGFYYSVGDFY